MVTRPHTPFTVRRMRTRYVRNGVLIWVFLRLVAGAGSAAMPGWPPLHPLVLERRTQVLLVLVVAGLVMLDIRISRERVLLGNLGLGRVRLVTLILLSVGVLEGIAGALTRMFLS